MVGIRRLFVGQLWARVLVSVLAVSLIAGATVALRASQTSAKHGLETRFTARAALAATFVSTYVSQLTAREKLVATNTLSGPDPTAAFNSDVQAFGFETGVLLDANGRALALEPDAPQLVGQQYGTKYRYLAAALNGSVAVSDVVSSAVSGPPVVAFAVPFDTPSGRRVFSGAYLVNKTPVTAFLNATTTLKNAELYITDGANAVLASNGPLAQSAQSLAQRNPELGVAATKGHEGKYRQTSIGYTFVKVTVPGTSWSLLIAAPTSSVFISVNGSAHWLPWLILAGLSLLIGLASWLALRLLAGRRRLADLNRELETLAHTDLLTGLSNRLHLTEQLEGLMANAKRHDYNLCVLMIDIDNFKQLNDSYGHQAGDQALRNVAHRLSSSLREGDLLARWGGEEFLAVLPYTSLAEGLAVAERLCHLVAGVPIAIGSASEVVAVQTSVGVAQDGDDDLDSLVNRADLGLYEAKAAGRNTVRAGQVVAATIAATRGQATSTTNRSPLR